MGRCIVCGGVNMIEMPMSSGIKCKDCGVEWHPSHPDPLALAMRLVAQDWNAGTNDLRSKIRVIKWYRLFKGIGLSEAKVIIDDLVRAFKADRSG
jgi:hypothetical protein